MRPLLKWAGGKRHIAHELLSRFPKNWRDGQYFEPFFGGGALFFELQPSKATISDLNARLIYFYKSVKKSPKELFDNIQEIANMFDECTDHEKLDLYLDLRKEFNSLNPDSPKTASLLYVLNKLCFNGLYRENSRGEFNVPFGRKKIFPKVSSEDFIEASRLFRNTTIANKDFEETVRRAESGDFVYFDPPYIPLNTTSNFTSYQSDGFSLDDQKRLAGLLLSLKKRGIFAMCSNSDTQSTRDIYKKLSISQIEAPRMVSAKASGRGTVYELAIVNY